LAASLQKRFGENAEIKAGKTGQFDVLVDGQMIFSKAEAGRFPADGEVEDIFAALKPAAADMSAASDSPKAQGGGARSVLRRMTDKFRN
jgi:predicted Rdx family selenoprotein